MAAGTGVAILRDAALSRGSSEAGRKRVSDSSQV
jgi:hypothetical protein